ncbi:competence type IV pilus assembly protein ComGB [Paucilactobacillus suebicus]|nr:competence type IV pilus assembly protein ComGB [Paucilactobacillus suebicus]
MLNNIKLQLTRQKNIYWDKFHLKDQAKWFTLLADLLDVGFSLKQSISYASTLMPKHKKIFNIINNKMESGELFAKSLKDFVGRDTFYQLLIAEKHGDLKESINQIGEFLRINVRQKQKLKALLQYPMMLFALLGFLMIGLKLFVFPELSEWQNEQSVNTGKLPYLSVIGWSFLIMAVLIAMYVVYKWSKSSTMNKVSLMCHLPILGKTYKLYFGYYLIANFSLLLKNGMGIKEICNLFDEYEQSSLLHQLGSELNQILEHGENPTSLIKRYPYLPEELIVFTNKGETVENLGKQLSVFSKILFSRLLKSIEHLLTMVQPILFGFVAMLIIAVYLMIMLPIYQSMKGIY